MQIGKYKPLTTYIALWLLFLGGCSIGEHQQPIKPQQRLEPRSSAEQNQSSAHREGGNNAHIIKPGQSIGLLRLGDSRERAVELFGKPEDDYTFKEGNGPCVHSEMHWYDVKLDRNGVFVYLKNGRIYQIVAATPRYVTAEGIKNGSTPESVRHYYSQIQTYALLNSGGKEVGGRDIIYWVDRQKGIAFELFFDTKANKRYVEGVVVFEPGTEFLPEGCVSPPQRWVELNPFALEPPVSKTRKPS